MLNFTIMRYGIISVATHFQILSYVFTYLTRYDKRNVRLTCSLWYRCCNHPSILNREKILVHAFNVDYTSQMMKNLDGNHIRPLNIEFQGVHLDRLPGRFWRNHGIYITRLELHKCVLSDKTAMKIIKSCTHMEHFKMRLPDTSGQELVGSSAESENDDTDETSSDYHSDETSSDNDSSTGNFIFCSPKHLADLIRKKIKRTMLTSFEVSGFPGKKKLPSEIFHIYPNIKNLGVYSVRDTFSVQDCSIGLAGSLTIHKWLIIPSNLTKLSFCSTMSNKDIAILNQLASIAGLRLVYHY